MMTSWLGNLAKKVLGRWTQSLKELQKMRMTQVAQMKQGQKKLPQVPPQMRVETQQQQAVQAQQQLKADMEKKEKPQLMRRARQDAFDPRAVERMDKQCGLEGLLGENHCQLTWFLTGKNNRMQSGHQMMKMMKLAELKEQKIPQQKTMRQKKGRQDRWSRRRSTR